MSADVVVEVDDLVVEYPTRRNLLGTVTQSVRAVDGVSLEMRAGETLGVVGESGCGKSTLAKALLHLVVPSGGRVVYGGQDVGAMGRAALRHMRRDVQLVFQDPFSSLDPRRRVGESVSEPLHLHRWPGDRIARTREVLERVGLTAGHADRYPHQLSGGQRQRVGIARALALSPSALILDEPVSALDVSIQAGIVNLLAELQANEGLSYLFISHDLSVVRHISHRVAVMYLGQVVESGTADEVYARPSHPYTKALLSAVPVASPAIERTRRRIVLSGDIPNPMDPPSGCRFRTRCWKDDEMCTTTIPELAGDEQHRVACHHPEADIAWSNVKGEA